MHTKIRHRNGALYTGGRGPDGRSGTAARPKESEISAPPAKGKPLWITMIPKE